jgi:DNA (cytosine-5)-methyltransferase 1
MRYLSLFSGIGGGDLGLQHLIGMECVGYVEWDKYCCRVLEQRIKDGFLADAPIFCGDIREWIQRGYADAYSGLVDVVAGGFPCQPFSVAGDMEAADDDRNMWPETIDVIRRVGPPLVLLENVPGLLSSGYGFTVTDDLQRAGYQVLPPIQLGAFDVGCNHKRNRIWIVAADPSCERLSRIQMQSQAWEIHEIESFSIPKRQRGSSSLNDFPRMDDEPTNRVDRLKAIGNGQVPDVAESAWKMLIG